MFFRKQPTATEKRILLKDVSWQKLQTVLAELGADRTVQLTYDRGQLEMMTPLEEHDRCNRLLESLILVLADELGDDLVSLGSMLLMHPEMGRAIQPMAAYYLEADPAIAQAPALDVTQNPPPDLAVEIIIKDGTLKRLALYESLGIPEVWQYITTVGDQVLQGNLTIWHLTDQGYVAQPHSNAYPFLSVDKIKEFLAESETLGLAKALTLLRSWAKTQA